jgi:hypothetical protein
MIGGLILLAFALLQHPPSRLTVPARRDGAPVVDAMIHVGTVTRRSNGQGHAILPLPPGTWLIVVNAVGALEVDWTGRQTLEGDPYRTTSREYVVAGMLVSQQLGRVKLFRRPLDDGRVGSPRRARDQWRGASRFLGDRMP